MNGADQLLLNALVAVFVQLIEGDFVGGADGGVNAHGHGDQRKFQMSSPGTTRFHN
jgi:hypothetical protein